MATPPAAQHTQRTRMIDRHEAHGIRLLSPWPWRAGRGLGRSKKRTMGDGGTGGASAHAQGGGSGGHARTRVHAPAVPISWMDRQSAGSISSMSPSVPSGSYGAMVPAHASPAIRQSPAKGPSDLSRRGAQHWGHGQTDGPRPGRRAYAMARASSAMPPLFLPLFAAAPHAHRGPRRHTPSLRSKLKVALRETPVSPPEDDG